jgi:hypothetical protein
MNAHRDPLEVERLLSENSLRRSLAADRRVSVEKHAAFQKSLTTRETFDEIDAFLEEIRQAEFEGKGAAL